MGRPASPNLPVRGSDRFALSDQKWCFLKAWRMKLAKRIGMKKAKVAIAARSPSSFTASGSTARRSTGATRSRPDRTLQVSWSGPPGWRCPAGTVVVVTPVNRLVAARPYPAVHVEAPDPDIIMRCPATSERTMTPAMASKRPLRFFGESRPIQYRAVNHMHEPRSPVSTTLTSSDGASATALLGVVLRVLDKNSQLKGELTAWSPVRRLQRRRFEVGSPRRLRHSKFLPTSRRPQVECPEGHR